MGPAPHNPTPYDDDFEDQPAQGPFHKWALGAGLPTALLLYGLHILIARQAEFSGENQSMTLYGLSAQAWGCAVISLALFLHCHYFWGNIYNQIWFAVLGKILSALGFISGLVILIVRIGLLGKNQ